jgi:hypothetical protein
VIGYDGYLQKYTNAYVGADTLIVVNNEHWSSPLTAKLEVFDKYGKLVWEGLFCDGGTAINHIPPLGFGWITLGMVVNRATKNPFGLVQYGEKFHIRISAALATATVAKRVPTVEVKQVIYRQAQSSPRLAIWQPWLIQTWAEAALGGNPTATGVAWTQ